MNVYIQVTRHVAEWCRHEYAVGNNAVRFPRGSAENDILELTLQKQPENAMPIIPQETPETLAIEIPNFKAKPPMFYNHLTKAAENMLAHTIYVRFRMTVWKELHTFDKLNLPIADSVWDFMERHGIDLNEQAHEAIRQMYFRQRKKYRENDTN